MDRKKEVKSFISKRNKRLKRFFELVCEKLEWDKTSFEIIGNPDTPAIIFEDMCLSCYVHNFNLIFTSEPDNGKKLYEEKLLHEQDVKVNAFISWLNAAKHRKMYKIQVKNLDLYLSGYNFKGEKGDKSTMYPVFSEHKYKRYFTKETAESIQKTYSTNTLSLIVI